MMLGILTLIHGREELTRQVLSWYHTVARRHLDLDLVAVASLEDTWASDIDGWSVIFRENQPLTDKWNAGMVFFAERQVDAVMVIGSDDYVHWTTLLCAAELCTEENPYWMPAGIFFAHTGRMIYRAFQRIGVGRVLHRSLLDKVGWRPWTPGKRRATDAMMDRVMDKAHGNPKRYGGFIVDVKSGVNQWSFDDLLRPGSYVEVDSLPGFD